LKYSAAVLRDEADRIYQYKIDQGHELDGMVGLLQEHPEYRGFIEIGAGAGGSFHVWSRCLPFGMKISVDHYDKRSTDPVERTWGQRDCRAYRQERWMRSFAEVYPIFGPSLSPWTQNVINELVVRNGQVDFLFIDGRWQDVEMNYLMYKDYVRKGGMIAVHCVQSDRDDAAPVRKLWADLKVAYPDSAREFSYGPHKSGRVVGGTGVVIV